MKTKPIILTLVLMIIIIFTYSVSASEKINVGLYYGDEALQTLTVAGEELSFSIPQIPESEQYVITPATTDNLYVSYLSEEDSEKTFPVFVNSAGTYKIADESDYNLIVSPSGNAIRITSDNNTVAVFDLTDGIGVQDFSDYRVSLNDREYDGKLLIRRENGNRLSVINRLDIESYLCGVLPYEMSSGWPIEALKAQAVAARNYVINNLNRHKLSGFDLCNTTHCQVYRGVAGHAEDCTQAVEETAGVYLYYDGKPAQTFYFSSSGGRTENVKDVWGSSFPYLVSVEDTYEKTEEIPSATWNYNTSFAKLSNQLNGYGVGTVKDVVITSTTDGERVKTLRVFGSNKTIELKSTEFRTLIGNSLIKGTYFTIEKSGGEPLYVLSSKQTVKKNESAFILSGGGTVNPAKVSAMLGKDGIKLYEPNYTDLVFKGRGYGHGVGMSQWGARGMAEAGFTYDQILTHYFTGTELHTEEQTEWN